MRLLGIILILQIGIVFFAWYQSYRNKEKFCKFLDIRAFWAIAVLFNLGGIVLAIYDYKCASSGQYDLVADEMWMEICFFIVRVLLSFFDVLAIYLLTKKQWNMQKILRMLIYVSVLLLLIVFKILVSPIYMRSFIFLFIEVNIVPVVISVCAYFCGIRK